MEFSYEIIYEKSREKKTRLGSYPGGVWCCDWSVKFDRWYLRRCIGNYNWSDMAGAWSAEIWRLGVLDCSIFHMNFSYEILYEFLYEILYEILYIQNPKKSHLGLYQGGVLCRARSVNSNTYYKWQCIGMYNWPHMAGGWSAKIRWPENCQFLNIVFKNLYMKKSKKYHARGPYPGGI
jgi:hypothetical protein